jgi:hypothetical protein
MHVKGGCECSVITNAVSFRGLVNKVANLGNLGVLEDRAAR